MAPPRGFEPRSLRLEDAAAYPTPGANWSRREDSHPVPPPYKGELHCQSFIGLEPRRGLAPRSPTYEAGASLSMLSGLGSPGWIRTNKAGFRKPCSVSYGEGIGARGRLRTCDLQLTKLLRCLLRHSGVNKFGARCESRTHSSDLASRRATANTYQANWTRESVSNRRSELCRLAVPPGFA